MSNQASRFAVAAAGRRVEVELLEGYACAQVFAPRNAECRRDEHERRQDPPVGLVASAR